MIWWRLGKFFLYKNGTSLLREIALQHMYICRTLLWFPSFKYLLASRWVGGQRVFLTVSIGPQSRMSMPMPNCDIWWLLYKYIDEILMLKGHLETPLAPWENIFWNKKMCSSKFIREIFKCFWLVRNCSI